MEGLPHPLLISSQLHMDELTLLSNTVEFKHVFYSWVAIALLAVIGICVRKRLKLVPTGAQNVLETIVDGLEGFTIANMGEAGRKFVPLLVGIFLYTITMNLFGLIPGFDAPTANLNTTAPMAIFVFLLYNIIGIRKWGVHYINQFTGPMKALIPLMLPLEMVSHLVRPLSLSFRLFGNIKGEELVLVIFFMLAPLFATVPIYFLFALAKCLQAFIFFMLTMVYIKGAIEGAEH